MRDGRIQGFPADPLFHPDLLRRREGVGSSSVAVVTSIDSARDACCQVSDVPQMPQKERVTPGDEANWIGVPEVNRNASPGKTAHASDGAPAASRQERQWHKVRANASPVAW
jgi:hypothetical protein